MPLWPFKYTFFQEYMFSFLRGIYPGVELQGPRAIPCLIVWGTIRLLSTVAIYHFTIPIFFYYYNISQYFKILNLFLLLFLFSPFPLYLHIYQHGTAHYIPLFLLAESVIMFPSPDPSTLSLLFTGLVSSDASETFVPKRGLFFFSAHLFVNFCTTLIFSQFTFFPSLWRWALAESFQVSFHF